MRRLCSCKEEGPMYLAITIWTRYDFVRFCNSLSSWGTKIVVSTGLQRGIASCEVRKQETDLTPMNPICPQGIRWEHYPRSIAFTSKNNCHHSNWSSAEMDYRIDVWRASMFEGCLYWNLLYNVNKLILFCMFLI